VLKVEGETRMANWKKDGFVINTEKKHLNIDTIQRFLSEESYWAKGISFESVKKAIDHSSLCFGIYQGNPEEGDAKQVGFARAITDFVRFAYIMDVFVLPEYRGKGLSKWLMAILTVQSELSTVDGILLCTFDAHGLYTQFGFEAVKHPENYLKLSR
jgi:GNAT superfamily N-acetyltransferase